MSRNILEYLRSKSEVDFDSQDIATITKLGPFVDCTSNQADAYNEFLNPERKPLLEKASAFALNNADRYQGTTYEELAVDVAMVLVSLSLVPYITGHIHVMANPKSSYSTMKLIDNARRIYDLCGDLDPAFDRSRLCVKIPATWEGLQACRKVHSLGIKTLATTVFTMEQSVLAAEVGCTYIAPFIHELKALFDETYKDTDPILPLCVAAQRYFRANGYATKVKAAGLNSPTEAVQLAGVATVTLPAPSLEELADMEEDWDVLQSRSLFAASDEASPVAELGDRPVYLNDREKYMAAYTAREAGKGAAKTQQAIDIFSEYQVKAEELMRSIAA